MTASGSPRALRLNSCRYCRLHTEEGTTVTIDPMSSVATIPLGHGLPALHLSQQATMTHVASTAARKVHPYNAYPPNVG